MGYWKHMVRHLKFIVAIVQLVVQYLLQLIFRFYKSVQDLVQLGLNSILATLWLILIVG